MTGFATYHKPLGWLLALAWFAAAALLVISLPNIEAVGEHGVFMRWTPVGAPLAIVTWVWAFGPLWRTRSAVGALTVAVVTWGILAAV
jgi:hypothetical protein